METESFQIRLYKALAERSGEIIGYFKVLYLIVLIFLAAGIYSTLTKNSTEPFFYRSGVLAAKATVVLLGVIVTPGILGRFRIEIRTTRFITLFRRYLGILIFLLALTHFSLVRFFPRLAGIFPNVFPYPFFEMIGLTTSTLLFLMFLTSNNFSKKKLGKWWRRLHTVIYIILWLVTAHIALQRFSLWSIFIGIFALLETSSLIYAYYSPKK